jgi:hypothetical protein
MRAVIAHSNDASFMPVRKQSFPQQASANQLTVQSKAACSCGGTCPHCASEWQQDGPTRLAVSTTGVHLQRQEAGSETAGAENGSEMSGADDSGNAQPAGIWDWIFGKDYRVECAHHLGACNISCRSLGANSQAYERCMTCCKTGYDICIKNNGAFITPEGGCARK